MRRWFAKEWREKAGLSQDQVAVAMSDIMKTGIYRADISNWERENSERRWNEDTLYAYATALNVEPWWLVGIDPTNPGNDLEILDAVRRVPTPKRVALLQVLAAFALDHDDIKPVNVEPPAAAQTPSTAKGKP